MITTNDWNVVLKELGYKEPVSKVKRKQKPTKCRLCGANMVPHPGTNVFTCSGTIEKEIEKDGKTIKISESCPGMFLRNRIIK